MTLDNVIKESKVSFSANEGEGVVGIYSDGKLVHTLEFGYPITASATGKYLRVTPKQQDAKPMVYDLQQYVGNYNGTGD